MRRPILAAVGAFLALGLIVASITVKGTKVPTLEEFQALVDRVTALEAAVFAEPSPSPTPTTTVPPAPGCTGTQVAPGGGLKASMDAEPAGTTFCLAAGTYIIDDPTTIQDGDHIIGVDRDSTHIDGSGLATTEPGIFNVSGSAYVEGVDVFGAPTPAPGGTLCSPSSNCGKAFILGGSLTLQSISCHDNAGSCVGGGGGNDLTVDDLDCYKNGSPYAATGSFEYGACIKRVSLQNAGADTTVTNSFIHDNYRIGLWCDFCRTGVFTVTGSTFAGNAKAAIDWEMSGGWSAEDRAVITGNTITGNNTLNDIVGAGIIDSSGNDIEIAGNTFGKNIAAVRILYVATRNPPQPDNRGTSIHDNMLNGDMLLGCAKAGVSCLGNS